MRSGGQGGRRPIPAHSLALRDAVTKQEGSRHIYHMIVSSLVLISIRLSSTGSCEVNFRIFDPVGSPPDPCCHRGNNASIILARQLAVNHTRRQDKGLKFENCL